MILQVIIAMVAGWINRHQQQVITYLKEENRVLKSKLPGGRLRLTDTERRRLAKLARPLSPKQLKDTATIATPDTLMRWYNRLIFSGTRFMLVCMKTLIPSRIHRIASWWRQRWYLSLEYLARRHQLELLKRSAPRPRFDPADRYLWLLLSTWWSRWPQALEIVQADTVRRWRRQGIWHHVKWRRGRKRPGRPPIPFETGNFIREMSRDNRLWGAPRIHGELAKLGINVSRTTVAKYMERRPGPPSPTWRTFWRSHTPDLHVHAVYAELSGRLRALVVSQKWRSAEIDVTLGLVLTAS